MKKGFVCLLLLVSTMFSSFAYSELENSLISIIEDIETYKTEIKKRYDYTGDFRKEIYTKAYFDIENKKKEIENTPYRKIELGRDGKPTTQAKFDRSDAFDSYKSNRFYECTKEIENKIQIGDLTYSALELGEQTFFYDQKLSSLNNDLTIEVGTYDVEKEGWDIEITASSDVLGNYWLRNFISYRDVTNKYTARFGDSNYNDFCDTVEALEVSLHSNDSPLVFNLTSDVDISEKDDLDGKYSIHTHYKKLTFYNKTLPEKNIINLPIIERDWADQYTYTYDTGFDISEEAFFYNQTEDEISRIPYYLEKEKLDESVAEYITQWKENPSKPIYLPQGTDGSYGKEATYLYFGMWPQTIKTNYVTIDTSSEETINGWTAYKGDDGCYYIRENSIIARAPYPSEYITSYYSDGQSFSKRDYYYKLEPIKWCIIKNDYENGKLLAADNIIDFMDTGIPKMYYKSNVRTWLNDKFYNKAFTNEAQNMIKKVSTKSNGEDITEDRVFLLSYREKFDFYTKDLKKLSDYVRVQAGVSQAGTLNRDTDNFGRLTSTTNLQSSDKCISPSLCLIENEEAIAIQKKENKADNEKKQILADNALNLANYVIFEDSKMNKTKDIKQSIVHFGTWPQSVKKEDVKIDTSKTYNINYWDCYKGDDLNYYVKATANPIDYDKVFKNGERIVKDKEYYFKLEPIRWKVLTDTYNDDKCLLSACDIVTFGQFDDNYNEETGEKIGYSIQNLDPSDFSISDLKGYLNGISVSWAQELENRYQDCFIDKAFSPKAIDKIDGYQSEKLFLLTNEDVLNQEYGFFGSSYKDNNRLKIASDYARALGVRGGKSPESECTYWLSSPHTEYSVFTANSGMLYSHYVVTEDRIGIAPAFSISKDHLFTLEDALEQIEKDKYIESLLLEEEAFKADLAANHLDEVLSSVIPLEKSFGTAGLDGKYVFFGVWPQSVKKDNVVIDESSKIYKNDCDYYKGSDNAYYVKYRVLPETKHEKFNDNSLIETWEEYYFKVEPIKWKIIKDDFQGGSLLVSETILQQVYYFVPNDYSIKSDERYIDNQTIYPNNYKYSTLRAFLNGLDGTSYNVKDYTDRGFINRAFSEEGISKINTVSVTNDLESTSFYGYVVKPNDYYCEDTNDKIFAPSTFEITNSNFGYDEYNLADQARDFNASDYIRSQTITKPDVVLRTPHRSANNHISIVLGKNKKRLGYFKVNHHLMGIVPALSIKIEE